MDEALRTRLAEVETRLRRLEDTEAIRVLKARYAELADARYGPGGPKPAGELAALAAQIAALFTEDAVWDGGPSLGLCRGRAEIEARFREPTLAFSWHCFVKPRIEVEGERARARWDVLAPCTLRDGRPFWMAGVEDDEYARVGGRWLHARMQLRVVLFAPHREGWGHPAG